MNSILNLSKQSPSSPTSCGLSAGSRHDAEDPNAYQLSVEIATIHRAALALLARREHSRRELRRKLIQKWTMAATKLIDQVLDDLIANNSLNDTRFAETYIRMRQQKGYGPLRITQELQTRGIETSVITISLNTYDWFACADKVRQKRFGHGQPTDLHTCAKQQRFLQYKGFSFEHIQHLLGK